MTASEDNTIVVRRYFEEVINQGNMAVMDELFAPNFVSYLHSGQTVDLESYKRAVGISRTGFPDMQVVIEDQLAAGDKVATRWRAHGTHQGMFSGVPPTHKAVTITAIHIHRPEHGKIVEHWEQFDILGLLQQLGLLPVP